MSSISHKSNFKHTVVIGGAQFVQIIANIIRAKFIAILLGPLGIGINGIMISAIGIITQIAGLGLNFSAVREISKDNIDQNKEGISASVTVIKYWLYATAILGAILTISLSYYLSIWSFDNRLYIWSFVVLSIAVAFNVLHNGNLSILQGLQKIKLLAYTSLIGAVAGLFTSIPLYYFWREQAIPYAIVVASVTALIISNIMVGKLKIPKSKILLPHTFLKGKEMASLGVIMMISQVIGLLVVYIINMYIVNTTSLGQLGLYQAGIGITTQYSAIVFNAMATEYFPRLSSVFNNKQAANSAINQQIEISLLIVTPIALLVVITTPIIIRVLLSSEFDQIRRFVELMSMSIILKGASFPIGYLSFARGDKKTFFLLEGVGGSFLILLSGILGFYFNGLNGIAYCTIISNFIYLLVIIFIARKLYGYSIDKAAIKIALLSIVVSFFVILLLHNYNVFTVVIASFVTTIVLIFYLVEINKITNILDFFKSKFKNK